MKKKVGCEDIILLCKIIRQVRRRPTILCLVFKGQLLPCRDREQRLQEDKAPVLFGHIIAAINVYRGCFILCHIQWRNSRLRGRLETVVYVPVHVRDSFPGIIFVISGMYGYVCSSVAHLFLQVGINYDIASQSQP